MKVLWISDGVRPTGFSRVAHGITQYLPEDYEIDWLAINYFGDPHDYKFNIYPAYTPNTNDFFGFTKIKRFAHKKYDLIFILNDVWNINVYLQEIKEHFNPIPPIVIYTPVDSINHYADWYKNFDAVTKVVAYNNHGKSVIRETCGRNDIEIIPHGIDFSSFYKLDEPIEEIRRSLLDRDDFISAKMIVLNANRNQPRKQVWNSLIGFSIFAKDKKDVFFVYHGGYIDADVNLAQLASDLKILDKFILTNRNRGPANLPDSDLNRVYNAANVGINTSIGEGWGLVNFEHALTGSLQIVPRHSSFVELFLDCGIFIEPTGYHVNPEISTIGLTVNSYHVAEKLQYVYDNPHLIEELGNKAMKKFLSDEYSWVSISKKWDKLFREVANANNVSQQHEAGNK